MEDNLELFYQNLSCPYFGSANGSHHQQIWKNDHFGHIVDILSHACVNGSLSELSLDKWNEICFPTHMEYTGLRIATGLWALFNFFVGTIGNSFTLLAIPYAKSKHRYEMESSFWMTDVWILNLALCDLLFCIFCLPQYFIPYLGYRYAQTFGTPVVCNLSFTLVKLTYTNDWLILSLIAMTRAIKIKYPTKWRDFCERKHLVIVCLVTPWIYQLLNLMPLLIEPSTDFGYNCLMGKCDFIPTGKQNMLPDWLVYKIPIGSTFFIPCFLMIGSYVLIWQHLKKTQRQKDQMGNVIKKNQKMREREIKFIWTVFIICVCFLVCSTPVAIVVDILEVRTDNPFLILIGIMWCQYGINFFIYAYRSRQYRAAYWDLIILVCPCLRKYKQQFRIGDGKTSNTKSNISRSAIPLRSTPTSTPKSNLKNKRNRQ